MNRLGIEALTTLGLPPVEFVKLAADLDCPNISTGLATMPVNPFGHPVCNLKSDVALRREMMAAMRDLGVSISLWEGFLVLPTNDVRDSAAHQFDVMHDLGVTRMNVVSMEPDLQRTLDQYATLAELARSAGFKEVVCEFAPGLTIRDLPLGLQAVRHVNQPNFKLLIDTMHLGRTGGSAADLAALDPALIGYVQLSDAPRVPAITDYMEEAMTSRLTPGEGEQPLLDMLMTIPRNVIVSLEVPQAAKAVAGASTRDIVQPIVKAARALLDQLPVDQICDALVMAGNTSEA